MIHKRRIVAGLMAAALFGTTLPALAFAQDEAGTDVWYAPEGVEWVLEGYLEDGSSRELTSESPDPATVTLLLQDGMASGTAGCNTYSGAYEIGEGSLTLGEELALTMMMCDEPQMVIEQAYLALLPTVAGWAVDGYALVLTDDEGLEILRYEEAVVELRGSDIAALSEAMADLAAAVTSLEESNAALTNTVAGIDDRVTTAQEDIGAINLRGVRDRVEVLEQQADQARQDITKLRENDKNQSNRIGGIVTRLDAIEASVMDLQEQVAIHFESFPVPSPEPK